MYVFFISMDLLYSEMKKVQFIKCKHNCMTGVLSVRKKRDIIHEIGNLRRRICLQEMKY